MRIVMVGSGYVGLVSGTCFADFGHSVTCVDKDEAKINGLKQGIMPIYEPGLKDLVIRNQDEGRLVFSTDLAEAIENADAIFIAVGTPSRRGDGHADLQYVYEAAKEIAHSLKKYSVIVTKSTVPVGTGDEIEKIIRDTNPNAEFAVASNPEFLREGAAIEDFKRPDRIVIGLEGERAKNIMQEIYRPLYLNQAPIIFTSRRTSELIKYAANAFLATKISFINEISDLCEAVGANVQEVARGIGMDNRIGKKFLHAGPGYGGSCFPKDTLALVKTAKDFNSPLSIVESVVAANEKRKISMADRVIKALDGNVKGKTIAILGLTFKPNTDDMREAPSIAIIEVLQKAGANIKAYDPQGMDHAKIFLSNITYSKNPYDCVEGADAACVITEWDIFRALDLPRVKSLLKTPNFIDLRNIYRPDEMKRNGFNYFSVGR